MRLHDGSPCMENGSTSWVLAELSVQHLYSKHYSLNSNFTNWLKFIPYCFLRKTDTKYQPICKLGLPSWKWREGAASAFSFYRSCWRPNHLVMLGFRCVSSSFFIVKHLMYIQNNKSSWLCTETKYHNTPLILKVKKVLYLSLKFNQNLFHLQEETFEVGKGFVRFINVSSSL